jgi:hypothetical protein
LKLEIGLEQAEIISGNFRGTGMRFLTALATTNISNTNMIRSMMAMRMGPDAGRDGKEKVTKAEMSPQGDNLGGKAKTPTFRDYSCNSERSPSHYNSVIDRLCSSHRASWWLILCAQTVAGGSVKV